MKEENSKDEINEIKETEEIVNENTNENIIENSENKEVPNDIENNKQNSLEPKRIKIPLIVLILFILILITGIVTEAILLLQPYLHFLYN